MTEAQTQGATEIIFLVQEDPFDGGIPRPPSATESTLKEMT